jgi:CheY-like chemotaxis protein
MKNISPFYFPTTVLICDDDNLMLDFLNAELGDEFKLITTTSSNEALSLAYQRTADCIDISEFIANESESSLQNENVSTTRFNFSAILKIRNQPMRQNLLSVLISDYAMPEVSGLELCKKLYNYPIKKYY